MTAYPTCLRQHGVNVPTARPTVCLTARPTGGFGAGSTTMQKAAGVRVAAPGRRVRLRRQVRRGVPGVPHVHGLAWRDDPGHPADRAALPARQPPRQRVPRAGRSLNGLDPNDPKVAAALKACQSKLPRSRGLRPAPARPSLPRSQAPVVLSHRRGL